jgi:cysteine desulfurase family protein
VIFTSNATEALNIAINGLFFAGDHIISTDLEHNSVLRPLYRLQTEYGVSLDFIPADKKGCIDYNDFDRFLRPETKAVVCTHASNLTGNTLDLRRICTFTRKHGLLFVVDASQTAGCLPINMEELGIDVLCFTGHKGLMGPQGTGGLCIRPGVEIRPWKVGGSGVQSYNRTQPEEYPTRLEAGTLNGHGLAGLSAAMDFILETGVDAIHAKEDALMRQFYEGVRAIDGVTVYGDFSQTERASIVSLNLRGWDSGEVSDALAQDYDIATRAGAHCAPRMHQALGTVEQGAVRFSFSYFNTPEEVDTAINAVRELAAEES